MFNDVQDVICNVREKSEIGKSGEIWGVACHSHGSGSTTAPEKRLLLQISIKLLNDI